MLYPTFFRNSIWRPRYCLSKLSVLILTWNDTEFPYKPIENSMKIKWEIIDFIRKFNKFRLEFESSTLRDYISAARWSWKTFLGIASFQKSIIFRFTMFPERFDHSWVGFQTSYLFFVNLQHTGARFPYSSELVVSHVKSIQKKRNYFCVTLWRCPRVLEVS